MTWKCKETVFLVYSPFLRRIRDLQYSIHFCVHCKFSVAQVAHSVPLAAHQGAGPSTSVAEPELEPVEQQLFAGAGAKGFFTRLRLPSRVLKFF
jgi:hypothetical protein